MPSLITWDALRGILNFETQPVLVSGEVRVIRVRVTGVLGTVTHNIRLFNTVKLDAKLVRIGNLTVSVDISVE